MNAVDVQMQIWQANLDLWRRLFDAQIALARGMMEISAAWTWREAGVAAQAEEAVAEAAEAAAETVEILGDAAADAAEAVVETVEAVAVEVAGDVTEPAVEAAPAKPATRRPPAASRRTTARTVSAPRGRRKPS